MGNIDMYAAVKDVRLPYDAAVADDDDDYDDYELRNVDEGSLKSWGSKARRPIRTLRSSRIKLADEDAS